MMDVFETDKYLSKVRTFGALGYDAERIADLLDLKGRLRGELVTRLSIPNDPLRVAYDNGRAIGEYNIDVELTKNAEKGDVDAIEVLATRSKERKMKDLKKDLFGI